MRRVGLLVLALVAFLAIAVSPAMAQLDDGSGTNAVIQLGSVLSVGGGIMKPIIMGIIGLCGGVGLYYRLARKAKVGT